MCLTACSTNARFCAAVTPSRNPCARHGGPMTSCGEGAYCVWPDSFAPGLACGQGRSQLAAMEAPGSQQLSSVENWSHASRRVRLLIDFCIWNRGLIFDTGEYYRNGQKQTKANAQWVGAPPGLAPIKSGVAAGRGLCGGSELTSRCVQLVGLAERSLERASSELRGFPRTCGRRLRSEGRLPWGGQLQI